ncbi:Site-specific recombinase XerD [Arthrobacter alpinus]|uniref:Site-specific recombinase XerD n=1 Tax=Arthrobacter alpinus TaxID=656366 RepID=A0A1H5H0A6_9MICC|nr:site-specific integrase [Arthrobacter alpinus]SEE21382.1 Site-specific recombinase XerD [Arthrobacter alpinus]
MASVKKRPDGKWRARYRDAIGKEHAQHFRRKIDANAWLDEVTAAVVTGTYIDPKRAKLTVGEWCAVWLKGYENNRPSSVRQARSHIKRIEAAFGNKVLAGVRPSEIRSWTANLKAEGLADSTIYALHSRLSHIFSDAVHDGLLPKSPLSRRTSPPMGKQRPYVATTEQVWALYDAMDAWTKPGILLGAFAGLRVAEAVALRAKDIDFMRGVISPAIQYPDDPLKSETSKTPIPIPRELAVELNRNPSILGSETIVAAEHGRTMAPYTFETRFRDARATIEGLPDGFRFHDLRHYFASLLISEGLDVKVVQARLRHASAKTTLDTYSHMWPDKDEASRTAVAGVLAARKKSLSGQEKKSGS